MHTRLIYSAAHLLLNAPVDDKLRKPLARLKLQHSFQTVLDSGYTQRITENGWF